MGHYDDAYEYEDAKDREWREKRRKERVDRLQKELKELIREEGLERALVQFFQSNR